jgi:hypothetical protein
MFTKLRKFYSGLRFFLFLSVFLIQNPLFSFSQECSQNLGFNFKPTLNEQKINWDQFPDFSLPFKVVYGGFPRFANPSLMLKKGYTHFSPPNDLTRIAAKNRAVIYYNCGSPNKNQPWETIKSPWGNNTSIYQNYWNTEIERIKKSIGPENKIDSDIFVFDIERQIKSDDSVLILKNVLSTPVETKNLTNDKFVLEYKKQLQALYFSTLDYTLKNGNTTAKYISSYADAPILNTFINIQGKSWEQWKTEKSVINYLTYDFDKAKVGGKFYDVQTLLTPSAYFYYDYPHPFAGEYLSYLLFQCEANRAWSNKELMLFIWLRYSYNQDFINTRIKPWMAEASAIFPFFAGAKGIWLWENTSDLKANDNLATYEYFTKGLFRVSQFKEIFEGDYKLIEAISARDYNENKQPIWRGVLNQNKIVVAAHNPYAKNDQEVVNLTMKYGSWSKEIKLKGYEIFMCKYDFDEKTSNSLDIAELVVYPNPNEGSFKIQVKTNQSQPIIINVHDLNGKLLYTEKLDAAPLIFEKTIWLQNKNTPEVIVSVETKTAKKAKKIILIN